MYSQNSKGNYCSTAVRSAIGKRKCMLLHYKFQAPQVVDFSGQTSFFFFFLSVSVFEFGTIIH